MGEFEQGITRFHQVTFICIMLVFDMLCLGIGLLYALVVREAELGMRSSAKSLCDLRCVIELKSVCPTPSEAK